MTTDKDKAWEKVSLPIPCDNVGRFFFDAGWDAHAERVKPLIEAARELKRWDDAEPETERDFLEVARKTDASIKKVAAALAALTSTDREGEKWG